MTVRCLDCHRLTSLGSRCPACRREYQRRRNAQRGGTGWKWSEIRNRILARDGYRCQEQGDHEGRLEVDHIVPLSQGGTNDPSNLITRCARHHKIKTAKERAA